MALTAVDGLAGAPWQRPLAGALDMLVVESELLAGNALGDPSRRPLWVYRSPGVLSGAATDVPAVHVIQGYTGQLDMWLSRSPFEPNVIERIDGLWQRGAPDCPDAVVVLVDAWTSLGGSQFLNSVATGRYMDYLCDEVVPFVDASYPTRADRDHRGIAGKSSGGYGAMVTAMMRPDAFGAFASHAGDALFECCYLPEFPRVARILRDHFDSSFEVLLERMEQADAFDFDKFGWPLMTYGMAACYSPAPDFDPVNPELLLPFEIATGRLVDDVWAKWLELDPVRMAPRYAGALRSMRRIYLDAGRSDEAFLDLGAQAFADELTNLGVRHTLELFEGRHGGISYRYPGAIRELLLALASG
jgi:putative esterase